MKLWSIRGNSQKLDGGSMFGNAPRAVWEKWSAPDALNRIDLACRALLASPGWAHELNALPGYQASHAGEVRSMASVLPWWQFKQPKRRAGMPARR